MVFTNFFRENLTYVTHYSFSKLHYPADASRNPQIYYGVDAYIVYCYDTPRYAMMSAMSSKGVNAVTGVVTEALPDTLFKVKLEDGRELLSFLAGKMRMHRIRVLIGDKVTVEIDPYGGKGRIVKRL